MATEHAPDAGRLPPGYAAAFYYAGRIEILEPRLFDASYIGLMPMLYRAREIYVFFCHISNMD